MQSTPSSLQITDSQLAPIEVAWSSPSNIALVKYWGKFGRQYPRNASVSFTLSACQSQTHLTARLKETPSEDISVNFLFEDQANEAFGHKIKNYFASILDHQPFLKQLHFEISSTNTFPHSSGIASSASGMSAIAMCLCELENQLFQSLSDSTSFYQKASLLARLGSGSASRSVYPKAALWGIHPTIQDSSNDYAIPVANSLHPIFQDYHDTILIVSRREKKVSSRAGHALMDSNIYAAQRYQQAQDNLAALMDILKAGDLDAFIPIVEKEAMTLHALMMTSTPSYMLFEPNTISVIKRLWEYREETGIPLSFTLDAGPNVHLLYPHKFVTEVQSFIKSELVPFCEGGYFIEDFVGEGPSRLSLHHPK